MPVLDLEIIFIKKPEIFGSKTKNICKNLTFTKETLPTIQILVKMIIMTKMKTMMMMMIIIMIMKITMIINITMKMIAIKKIMIKVKSFKI